MHLTIVAAAALLVSKARLWMDIQDTCAENADNPNLLEQRKLDLAEGD